MSSQKTSTLFLILAIITLSPGLSFAQKQSPLDIALRHLEQNQENLKLTADDIKHYQVSDLYTSKHNGVTHVYLNQTHENIKVLNAIINVNILPDGKVLNMGNRFIPHLQRQVNGSNPSITPAIALQNVISNFDIKANTEVNLQSKVNDQHFIFDHEGIALDPISVKLVYQKVEGKSVRLAWMVQLYQLDAQHWWNVKVDAQTGEILAHRDQVIHCNFGTPEAACTEHGHDHGFIKSDVSQTKSMNPAVLANSYNVFPLFIESPNHGSRQLLSDPADLIASPFGWHDTDGVDGNEFTITRGNNVHAYQDVFNNNNSIGDEPDGGADLDFDFPLDLSTNLPYTQADPAVVNLFYWNNTIHDLWYQYGFDEASGNFQVNNYGNGGQQGDYVRAEALDGAGTNNANFGTGEDGTNARMQMFIWGNNPLPPAPPVELIVTEPAGVAGSYLMSPGAFGGMLPFPAITSEIVPVDDGTGVTSDACEDIINGADFNGKIALIDRGSCQFGVKVLKAENAGAIAVIVCNNDDTDPTDIFPMGPGTDGAAVTIPIAMVSLNDCNTIKTALPGVTVEFGQEPPMIPLPGPAGIDGDFDNGIIAHEYGHGISIRLTGGPGTGNCLGTVEQAGEGWSDWFGLVMTTTSSDNAEEGRGIGTFAQNQPTTGGGIREFRYSRDMNINPHTYGDVPNVAVPHGVGSVWCAMIWDLYWNMVDVYGFDDDIFNGTGGNNMTMQLVIDGLKLQECDPSFIDSRNAILEADSANYDGVNTCLIWETFARRGLGFSASPGGNEAFDIPAFCTPLQINKTASSEVLSGDVLTYTLEIKNNVANLISDATVSDEFPAGTSYVEGSLSCTGGSVSGNTLTINVGDLPANSITICTYQLLIDPTPFSVLSLEDDVEEGEANWDVTSDVGAVTWETNNNSFEGDLAWFAADIDSECDQYLALAESILLDGTTPSLAFWHWYDTEATWDGGVVEISTDDGNNWSDLGDNMVQNGYNSTLEVNPASPISGQPAFNGNSGGYLQTVVDLSSFNGEEVLIRFRFGCDGAVGGNGWFIDNIQFFSDFHSITNIACASGTGQESTCSEATTTVFEGDLNSTNDLENDLKISISPNPTSGVFTLNMNSSYNSNALIQVIGIDGRLLNSSTFDRSNGAFEFDLSNYPAGIYLIKIQTDQAQVTQKIVIQ